VHQEPGRPAGNDLTDCDRFLPGLRGKQLLGECLWHVQLSVRLHYTGAGRLDNSSSQGIVDAMEALSALVGLSFGWLWLMFVFFLGTIGLAGTVLWIWILVEVLSKETDEGNTRLIWTLVVIFTRWIGALIYLIVRRPERLKKLGK